MMAHTMLRNRFGFTSWIWDRKRFAPPDRPVCSVYPLPSWVKILDATRPISSRLHSLVVMVVAVWDRLQSCLLDLLFRR
jgi:hypothetical protein